MTKAEREARIQRYYEQVVKPLQERQGDPDVQRRIRERNVLDASRGRKR